MPDRPQSDLLFQDIPDPVTSGAPIPAPPPAPPEEPSPTRAQRSRSTLLAVIVAPAWIALAALGLGIRGDIADSAVVARVVVWSALGAIALLSVLRPRARGLPPGARVVQLCLVAVPILYAAAVLAIPRSAALHPGLPGAPYGCIALSILLAAVPLALAAVFLRRTFLSLPGLRGAAVGAVCGVAGAAGLHAHCSVETTLHLLLGHGTGIVVCALIGAALGVLRGRA